MHKNVTRLTSQVYRGFEIDHGAAGFVVGSVILMVTSSLSEVRQRIDQWCEDAKQSEQRRRTQKRTEIHRRCG